MNSTVQKTIYANVLLAYPLDQEFTYCFNEFVNEFLIVYAVPARVVDEVS